MHRLPSKGPIPDCLHAFCRKHPDCRDWDFFYDNYRQPYGELKNFIFKQQGGVCAYCEDSVVDNHQQRIEHFHPKSHNDPTHNWTFDWMNMLGCCMGGSTVKSDSIKKSDRKLHCDAHKETCSTNTFFKGDLLNPLTMPFECLFDIDRDTGELKPNKETCAHVTIPAGENNYDSVFQLVDETIRILNLNCDSLKKKRLSVIKEFERERKSKRQNPKANKKSVRTAIAQKWFEGRIPSFFTTRRILLGHYAEQFIPKEDRP